MKTKGLLFSALLGAVLLVQTGYSTNPFKSMSWAVGQWASYEMKSDNGTQTLKYSITGTETIDSKTYYWFETSFDTKQGHMVMKVLMAPGNSKAQRTIMKMGDQPAMEFDTNSPMGRNHQMNKPPIHSDDEINKATINSEKVTVPAGTFTAVHAKIIDKENNMSNEAWVSNQIPILGVVKSVGSGAYNNTMTLQKYGTTGAKTEITETPKKFDMQQMMNQGRSRNRGSSSEE